MFQELKNHKKQSQRNKQTKQNPKTVSNLNWFLNNKERKKWKSNFSDVLKS